MAIELRIPAVGESISEVEIGPWLKAVGEAVRKDDVLMEIETDKATFQLPAPADGVISRILKNAGDKAAVGEVIGFLEEGAAGKAAPTAAKQSAAPAPAAKVAVAPAGPKAARAGETSKARGGAAVATIEAQQTATGATARIMPAARAALAEHGLAAGDVAATGPGGRLLKEDVLRHVAESATVRDGGAREASAAPAPAPAGVQAAPPPVMTGDLASGGATGAAGPSALPGGGDRQEDIVPMTPLRRRVAQRLVEAQQTAALLTTFNEIDMSGVLALRKQHQETFEKRHGVKLGLMSFFVKAAIDALKSLPQLNAEIRGSDIVYKNYYDIGVAVSGGKGLVVPIIRNAERLSFAEIEKTIADFGARGRENKIALQELQGGTFTISNGGVFGSLLSTPIVNPPQSAILGLHAIQDRPVARDGQVVVRSMMYVALTYDHRIVDGREAVTFLKRIKECVEEPTRMLLES